MGNKNVLISPPQTPSVFTP